MRWWVWTLVAWGLGNLAVVGLGWWAGHPRARARARRPTIPGPPSRV